MAKLTKEQLDHEKTNDKNCLCAISSFRTSLRKFMQTYDLVNGVEIRWYLKNDDLILQRVDRRGEIAEGIPTAN